MSYKLDLNMMVNDETLNIFTDASMNKIGGSFGAIAVYKNNIIDSSFWYSRGTINECEAKGLRCGLALAFRHFNEFNRINIFCDSLLTVNSINDYIYRWRYNEKDHCLYTVSGSKIANQSILVEDVLLYKQVLMFNKNIFIFHQNGHINSQHDIAKAANNFLKFNKIDNLFHSIDEEFIKFIALYNNIIDNITRIKLQEICDYKRYDDPFIFSPTGQIKRQ